MKIDLYSMCYNEQMILPFFLRHYEKIADRMFIYDNMSTDDTARILKAHPQVVYRSCDTQNECRNEALLAIKNEEWKKSSRNSDYVIVVDADEFIYHPSLLALLDKYNASAIECVEMYGYSMVGDQYPPIQDEGQIYDRLFLGVPDSAYNKTSIFAPQKIDIRYDVGAHSCKGSCGAKMPRQREVKLLHYDMIDLSGLIARWKMRNLRRSQKDRENHWGGNYALPAEKIRELFEQTKEKAVDVRGHAIPAYESTLRGRLAGDLMYCFRGGRKPVARRKRAD